MPSMHANAIRRSAKDLELLALVRVMVAEGYAGQSPRGARSRGRRVASRAIVFKPAKSEKRQIFEGLKSWHPPAGVGDAPLDPLERPVSLLGDAGNVLHGLEEVGLLLGVLDVRVDEQRVHLCGRAGVDARGRRGSVPVMCFEKARLPLLAPRGRGRRDDVTRTGVDVLDGDLEAVERASLRAGSEERGGRR